jgi:ribonuclease R
LREILFGRILEGGSAGASVDDLLAAVQAELGAEPAVGALDAELEALKAEGEVVLWARHWRAIRTTPWLVGLLRRSGRLLEVVARHGGGRYVVPATRTKGALPGDLVLVRPERAKRGRQRQALEASVLEVLKPRSRRFVGCLVAGKRGPELVAWDFQNSPAIGSLEVGEAKPGEWVVVEVGKPGVRRTQRSPVAPTLAARVVERLGSLEDASADVRVVCRHHRLGQDFPRAVLEEAELLARRGVELEPGRADRRGELVVTIDGADAKDFDDAIQISRSKVGWSIGVHIADVGHYVRPGSAIDAEARRRGTSVYFPEHVVPMLPAVLSDDLCSLRPEVDRLVVSVSMEIDTAGAVRSRRFERAVIRSRRRLTYDQAQVLLENPEGGGELRETFEGAREVLRILRSAREARGSLDVDLPAVRVHLDDASRLSALKVQDRLDAHRLIEELMILANRVVAEALDGAGRAVLHRVHDAPDAEDLEELRRALMALGDVELEADDEVGPATLQRWVAAIPDGPLADAAAMRALKAMKRAVYMPESRGHWALGLPHYLHFTSPIRRYPDLVAHRQLVAEISSEPAPPGSGDLEMLGKALSTAERTAEAAEREISSWKRIRALAGREGEVFGVTVTDVQNFGAFVRLDSEWVDGLIPAWAFGEGPWKAVRAGTVLKQLRGAARVRLGDRFDARLTRVDLIRRQIDLEPVDGGNRTPEKRVRPEGRPRGGGVRKEKRRR